jgi:glucose-6-phosphate isomerase
MPELISSAPEWRALADHHRRLSETTIAELFAADPVRAAAMTLETGGVLLDYSRNLIDAQAMSALYALAQRAQLSVRVKDYFAGASVNASEGRPALHWLFRDPKSEFSLDGVDLMPEVRNTLRRMGAFCSAVRTGAYRGASGERIADVVNVGIGGSDIGPRLATEALGHLASDVPRVHFLSNVDGHGLDALLGQLHPAHTLCIITSKSFSTPETIRNAETLKDWLGEESVARQMVAVTADRDAARAMGFADPGIFPLAPWIGGRYSLWSAVGIGVGIALGMEVFHELLEGGKLMDEHFRSAPVDENIPVTLGLLDIWHRNICAYPTRATVVYDDRLRDMVPWLQQLVMESLGKSVTNDGAAVNYATAPVVWGGTGTPAEHSFFQALHQGTGTVPLDLVGVIAPDHDHAEHHRMLLAHLLGQAAALTHGDSGGHSGGRSAGDTAGDPHRGVPGNRPCNVFLLDRLTPHSLGALLALQEHRVFVQAVVLDVNPFDQFGVELGKRLAGDIEAGALTGLDSSMDALLQRIRKS